MKHTVANFKNSCLLLAITTVVPTCVSAQSVCLPAPRLLTTMPMGGKVGTTFDVKVTGQDIEDAEMLSFSHPAITATPKLDASGLPIANQFVVSIKEDCPPGIHEARVMARLGVSASRAFSVGTLAETTRTKANINLQTAMPLELNSVCNAAMTKQAIDYFTIEATKGQRILIDCDATGIDSKLKPVVIVADESGADLVVERRSGQLDFTATKDGRYVIKVHDLTYSGGPYCFYRLVLREAKAEEAVAALPTTRSVSSCSWPPHGLAAKPTEAESEPNNKHSNAQKITLPCDLSGSFFPAADVDTFEFTAKKGEVWWVEVASERLGLPTDPFVLVQHVGNKDGKETLTDVAELSDIATPVKVSTNGYSYDGPPYNAGSTDVLGKLTIKQDGVHRLQIRDLFGGTRRDARNIYRLIIRKAQPDFALVGWAMHMGLRNGDRNALSKPIALRGGATMPIEVVVIRRDGFDGEIELFMENLPPGVTATGLKISAKKTRGIMLISADEDAARGLASATFFGKATIDGKTVKRKAHLASMKWPVPNARSEIPNPRLLADVPVSVCGSEAATITIAPAEDKVWEITAGQKLTIPLKHTRRCEFSGANISLKTFGGGFEKNAAFNATLKGDASQAILNLAKLKPAPGDYVIAFYGGAVAKYQNHPGAVTLAQAMKKTADQKVAELVAEGKQLAKAVKTASAEQKARSKRAVGENLKQQVLAKAAAKQAAARLKAATRKAKPKDIADIVVSRPIRVRVKPAEKK